MREKPFAAQFAFPQGKGGYVAGVLMALLNGSAIRHTVELLDPKDGDRILEIGAGPGLLVNRLYRRIRGGLVAGIDPSAVMTDMALRRNKKGLRRGNLIIREAGVSSIPFPDASFDKIAAVHSFQFWPNPESDVLEVARVMKPGGKLVLALRLSSPKIAQVLLRGRALDYANAYATSPEAICCLLERYGFMNARFVEPNYILAERRSRNSVCNCQVTPSGSST